MSKDKNKPHSWIDSDTADRITSMNLKEYRAHLKKDIREWKKNPKSDTNPKGKWIHPEDLVINMQTISALNLIISHFITTPTKIK